MVSGDDAVDVTVDAAAEFGTRRTALVVGTSRGIGARLVPEFLDRGWDVVATVRGETPHDLVRRAEDADGRLTIEALDMTEPEQATSLRERLAGQSIDLLLVNAAITQGDVPVEQVATDSFTEVMVTNALSPLRLVDVLGSLVPATGTIAVMSSSQGSISLNTVGHHDVYRASKSALNQLVRSYVARHDDDPRTYLLIHPGHVQTELGGPGARLTVDDSAPGVVDVLLAHTGEGGLQFRDHRDEVVPW